MRLVLDTNVLISAALKPGGLEASVVDGVIAGEFLGRAVEAWVTAEIWAEYEEVFARPKFAAWRDGAARMLAALGAVVRRTAAIAVASAARDEDDNRFLECAEAAGAEFLVTGNLRHYPLEYGGARMVNARGLWAALQAVPGIAALDSNSRAG